MPDTNVAEFRGAASYADQPACCTADRRGPDLTIGRVGLGSGRPAYVIAEAGVNHHGSPQAALEMIEAARRAGAQAVKFQVFRAEELASPGARTAAYQRAAGQGGDQRAMLKKLELRADDFRALREACQKAGIEFLGTPFDQASLCLLRELDVAAIKIASTDLTNTPLLEDALTLDRPLLVSTGASRPEEISRCVELIGARGGRAALLHCVSAYPVPEERANLRRIRALAERFGLLTGFSDHTQSIEIGALAVAAGACMVEKHFTLDRTQPGPDQSFSLEPEELKRYVERIRRAEAVLGDGSLPYQEIEEEVRNKAGRSVVARCAIGVGEKLTREKLCLKRPGGGLGSEAFEKLLNKHATAPIAADQRLTWSMVE